MMEWILSACVLTAAVIGLRYALGGRIDPRLQYALWALVLVRLLIPVNFGWAPFSVGNASPPWPPAPLSRRILPQRVSPSPAFRPPTQHRPPPRRPPTQRRPPPSPSPLERKDKGCPPSP